MVNLKDVLTADERYSGFKFVDKPMPFSEWANNKDYPIVQVHDSLTFEINGHTGIIGFVGCFEWKNNRATSLDGDTYDTNGTVIAYDEFDGGVDILVKGGEW